MIRNFIIGIVIGIGLGAAAAYFVPLVDQARERSIIEVAPNGGNLEVFHVNVPDDRILIGAADQTTPLPRGLEWPRQALLGDSRTEVFKIRNVNDVVIGVASRIAVTAEDGGQVEWAFHMPVRGSGYIVMAPQQDDQAYLLGEFRRGTREFADLVGVATEQWIANPDAGESDPVGKIQVTMRYVAAEEGAT